MSDQGETGEVRLVGWNGSISRFIFERACSAQTLNNLLAGSHIRVCGLIPEGEYSLERG